MRQYGYDEVEWWTVDHGFSDPIVYVAIVMVIITLIAILKGMNDGK